MTSEEEKHGQPGTSEELEVKDNVKPEDIEVLRDGEDWADEGAEEQAETAGSKSGKKKGRKVSKADLAAQFARKNEMLQKLRERLEEAEELLDKKEDRLIRLAAEFEHYKKRPRKEPDLLKNQANAGLMTEILGILDDLDRPAQPSAAPLAHFR